MERAIIWVSASRVEGREDGKGMGKEHVNPVDPGSLYVTCKQPGAVRGVPPYSRKRSK